jgi:hypothetical protein
MILLRYAPRRALTAIVFAPLLALAAACGDAADVGNGRVPADVDTATVTGAGTEAGRRTELRFGSTAEDAAACHERWVVRLRAAADSVRADTAADGTRPRMRLGEDPVTAVDRGWPPEVPEFRDEVILPCRRIVAYYGNPLQTRMGVLGEYPKDEML